MKQSKLDLSVAVIMVACFILSVGACVWACASVTTDLIQEYNRSEKQRQHEKELDRLYGPKICGDVEKRTPQGNRAIVRECWRERQ